MLIASELNSLRQKDMSVRRFSNRAGREVLRDWLRLGREKSNMAYIQYLLHC